MEFINPNIGMGKSMVDFDLLKFVWLFEKY